MSRIVLPIALCLLTISSSLPSVVGQVEQATSTNDCVSAGPRNDLSLCFNPVVTLPIAKTWGGNSTDNPRRISLDKSGNIYMAGTTTSFGNNDSSRVFLVKYDTNGSLQWQRTWETNQTSLYDMTIDPTGAAIYLTGSTAVACNPACKTALFLLRFDSSGNLDWQKLWLPDQSQGNGVAVDQSENVYVVGSTPSPGICGSSGKETLVFLKLNQTGTLLSENHLCAASETTFGFLGLAVALDNKGDTYVLGADDGEWTSFLACAIHSVCNAILFKFDSTGRQVWNVTIPGGYTPLYGNLNLSVDASGSVYVGGAVSGGDSNTPIQSPLTSYAYIAKFDSSGAFQWGRFWGSGYGGAGDTQGVGYSIATNSSGFSYVTGSTTIATYPTPTSFANDQETAVHGVLLLKFDPSGDLLSDMLWGPGSEAYSITLDATGNGYVAGSTLSHIGVQKLYPNIRSVYQQGGGVCCATYFTNDTTGSVRGTVPCCMTKSTTLIPVGNIDGIVRSPAGVEAFTGKQGSFFFKYQESDMIKPPRTISLPPIAPIIIRLLEVAAAIGAIAVTVTIVALLITRRRHRVLQPSSPTSFVISLRRPKLTLVRS